MESTEEIKMKLQQLRKDNRNLALVQRQIQKEIKIVQFQISELNSNHKIQQLKLEQGKKKFEDELNKDLKLVRFQRNARRRDLMNEIHNEIEANKQLERNISSLQAEISRIKEIRAAYSI